MKPLIRFRVGRFHFLLAQNPSILKNIERGLQKKRSFRFDRVPGQFFISLRNKSVFLNIDWI
jgi:hypothetical protein